MSRVVALLWWLIALLAASAAQAHTLGIERVWLEELPGGRYVLEIRVPPRFAQYFRTPQLPERCRYLDGEGAPAVGRSAVRYEFDCGAAPLTANDVLSLPWLREGVFVSARWLDGVTVTQFFRRSGDRIDVRLSALSAGAGSVLDTAQRYTLLGIEHILSGVDHLLFVLGLLLLATGLWSLLKTITAFTLAHSITLAAAALGLVELPSRPVEAAIALSIMFVAVEVVRRQQGASDFAMGRPWLVAFGFGLLHGFGFAGALAEIGLPRDQIPVALLFFNVGVELGQLMFVAVVLAMGWMVRRMGIAWPRWATFVPAYGIGTIAAFWLLERTIPIVTGG